MLWYTPQNWHQYLQKFRVENQCDSPLYLSGWGQTTMKFCEFGLAHFLATHDFSKHPKPPPFPSPTTSEIDTIWTKPLIQVLCHLGIAFHFALPGQLITFVQLGHERPTCTHNPAICMTQQPGKWNFEREWTYCEMTRRSFHRPNQRNAANQVSELTFLRRHHGQNLTNGGMYVHVGFK